MRDAKPFARGVDEFSFKIGFGREADAVHQTVQDAIFFLQVGEKPRELIVLRDIAHEAGGAGKLCDQIFGFEGQALILVGDGEAPAGLLEFLRDGPSDAAFVGQAEDYGGFLRVGHIFLSRRQYCTCNCF